MVFFYEFIRKMMTKILYQELVSVLGAISDIIAISCIAYLVFALFVNSFCYFSFFIGVWKAFVGSFSGAKVGALFQLVPLQVMDFLSKPDGIFTTKSTCIIAYLMHLRVLAILFGVQMTSFWFLFMSFSASLLSG